MNTQSVKLEFVLSVGKITDITNESTLIGIGRKIYRWDANADSQHLDFLSYIQEVKSIKDFINNVYKIII